MKSGFVTIVGRPNAGKSTLINSFTGEKVAITSAKPQTTRTNLKGIVNREGCQLIFIDTPGIHSPRNKLGEYMVESAYQGMEAVDAVIYMFDALEAQKHGVPKGDEDIIAKLAELKNTPVFLAVNKVDAVPKESILGMIAELASKMEFKDVFPISALKKDGTEMLLQAVEEVMPEGPAYYDSEIITDSTVKEICAEMIREKILRFTSEEVPHGSGVEIIIFKEPKDKRGSVLIEANIYCEKQSHKGILIGKDGAMLKRIGTSARYDMEKLLGQKVNLKLWVKVKDDWRNSPGMLKELGYTK